MEDSWTVREVKSALEELFGDTSVSQEITLEHLGNLRDTIDEMMQTIKEDLRMAASSGAGGR